MKTDMLISQIRSASRVMVRQLGLLDNQFATIGSTSQCHALVELDAHGVMNLGQLSTVLNLEKSTASRLVTQLHERGICQIQADENDRRNKLISLTKKGVLLVNKIHLEAKLQVQQALDMMSDEEKNIVVRGLSTYAKALKRSKLLNEYTIRKIHKNDVPQLINLTRTVWAEFGFDSSHPEAPLFEIELSKTYETYTGAKSDYLVLVHGKKIMGGIGFAPIPGIDKHTCELKGMYLSSQLRGLGLGASLLKKVLEAIKKEGFKKCYLETMSFMHGANALYKKFGFKQLDKPMGDTGHTWTNCWYIKEIT
jgi:putative acetyltransferase